MEAIRESPILGFMILSYIPWRLLRNVDRDVVRGMARLLSCHGVN